MKNNSVAVIIPSFNPHEDDLARGLDSVLAQTLEDIEIVVVDDGSEIPFGGLNKSERFATVAAIQWLALDDNGGVAAARNAGVHASKSPFVAFLDADDWWEPSKLEMQIKALQNDSAYGLVYCGVCVHADKGSRRIHPCVSKDAYRELLVRQPITGGPSAVVVPRTVFDSVGGFFTAEDIPEDKDFFLRVARRYEITFVQALSVHRNISSDSRSANPFKKARTYKRFLTLHRNEIESGGLWNDAVAQYHVTIGLKYFAWHMFVRGTIHIIRAAFIRPPLVAKGIAKRLRWRPMMQ